MATPDPPQPDPSCPKPEPVTAPHDGAVRIAPPAGDAAGPPARPVHGVDLTTLEGTGPRGRITRSDVAARAEVPDAVPARTRAALASPAPRPRTAARRPAGRRRSARRADPPAAADRPADGRGEGDRPALPGPDRGRGRRPIALRAELKELREGVAARRSTTSSSRPARWRCASIPAPTAPTSTGASSCTSGSTSASPCAAEDALIVPTIVDADAARSGEIAAETRRLAERVREATMTPPELSGATFTVSNLGMYGMTAITPVINPPQAAILGVGAVRERSPRSSGRDRRPPAADPDAELRPPDPVRRRRGAVPGRDPRRAAGAAGADALIQASGVGISPGAGI